MNSVFFTAIESVVIAGVVGNPNRTVCGHVMINFFNHHMGPWIGNNRNVQPRFWITVPTQSGSGELPKQADSTQLVAGDQGDVDLFKVGIFKQFYEF